MTDLLHLAMTSFLNAGCTPRTNPNALSEYGVLQQTLQVSRVTPCLSSQRKRPGSELLEVLAGMHTLRMNFPCSTAELNVRLTQHTAAKVA